ncbi:unknown [Coraliomargarita sp. CAG:312]|nr:unknown [Coraliomargarita sp. CAG:312]
MVGVAELESATPCVSCKCSNQLSYTPVVLSIVVSLFFIPLASFF